MAGDRPNAGVRVIPAPNEADDFVDPDPADAEAAAVAAERIRSGTADGVEVLERVGISFPEDAGE